MDRIILKIKENSCIAKNVYKMVLEGDVKEHLPGQFVNISVPGTYLRRPISVCDSRDGLLTLCYKIAGEGTRIMSDLKTGSSLDVLAGLGNGYDLSLAGDSPVLIGGGMGTAPLYYLAKKLTENHTSVNVAAGFNTADEVFLKDRFESLNCRLSLATLDGSAGIKGFATDTLPKKYSYFYCCGPLPMMKAVNQAAVTSGQFSLEERMGCGFGACMGCSLKTRSGHKRICTEGPVFKREEIIWED